VIKKYTVLIYIYRENETKWKNLMSYFYIGMITIFLIAIVLVGVTMDKEDLK
jgi:hypothetical protein